MALAFCGFVLRARIPLLVVLALLTAFFATQIPKVTVESRTIDLFPSTHPYVRTFVKYSDVFGGASRIVLQVEVQRGTIWQKPVLEKIQRITRAIELLPAVNNYQVLSLAQRKVKELRMDATRGFRAVPVMWPSVPETEQEIAEVRGRVLRNRRLYGALVSLDEKAALIVAGFFEQKLDPVLIHRRIDELVRRESDATTRIQAIGRPLLVGSILDQTPRLMQIMAATLLAMLLVLWVYFRNLVGVLVPSLAAAMSAVMGVGFLGLLGQNFDPLVLVIPFIITARAISHSVQIVARFLREAGKHGEGSEGRLRSTLAASVALFKPGTLAIVTDVVGILLILLAPIPLLQKLCVMAAFWFTSIFLSGMVLSPILLSLLPVKVRESEVRGSDLVTTILRAVGRLCIGPRRPLVFLVALATVVIGFAFARTVQIGDVHPGTPMLWPSSRYNQDTDLIARRFANTEELTVVVEGASRDAIKQPEVLRAIEAFQRHMEELDEVGATSSLVDVLPSVISVLHGGDPKWELVPNDKQESGFFLEMMYGSSEPGDLTRFVTIDSKNANVTLYLRDHRGETLRTVVEHAQRFIDSHPVKHARFRLAGGYGGLLAAINEVVTRLDAQITFASFFTAFLTCVIAFRSLFAGVFFLLPLIGSNYMTYALMGALGIGLDVNALPVVALGVGLGIDYGLYVVEAIQGIYRRGASVPEAVALGIETAGKGVLVTGFTMLAGLAFWWLSFLRFQAEMGVLLLFWMFVSMLGGLILLPAILVQWQPSFVFGRK